MSAPRLLRPVKMDGGHYGAWGNYASDRDPDDMARCEGGVGHGEGKCCTCGVCLASVENQLTLWNPPL